MKSEYKRRRGYVKLKLKWVSCFTFQPTYIHIQKLAWGYARGKLGASAKPS